ncbi:hypothetical protein MBAV_006430 [Candidatus Magnetobacterium bavaricum]|uniref:Uncharacterized protein n=1 Tax=Candidatus Magnetobacterium bavaricum TaxID=29290 RepID=A0A0F3GL27_9BACT|nr:hypothetical protein MBAV_006430 [Candidatus Magnetobacterium bavaricum]
MTIAHEISHSYARRIRFRDIDKKLLEDFSKNVKTKSDKSIEKHMSTYINIMAEERFAEWFYFRHFYNGDIYFFLYNIWRTWLRLPQVKSNIEEYLSRSVFIMAAHDIENFDKIKRQYRKSSYEEERPVIDGYFTKQKDILTKNLGKWFNEDKIFDKNSIETAKKSFFIMSNMIAGFELDYFNEKLRNSICHTEKKGEKNIRRKIEKQKNAIISGEIVKENVTNPFLLIREIVRHYYDKENYLIKNVSPNVIMALILSLK